MTATFAVLQLLLLGLALVAGALLSGDIVPSVDEPWLHVELVEVTGSGRALDLHFAVSGERYHLWLSPSDDALSACLSRGDEMWCQTHALVVAEPVRPGAVYR